MDAYTLKCLRLSFRALRGNEIMQLRKIHAFFLLSRHLKKVKILESFTSLKAKCNPITKSTHVRQQEIQFAKA